MDRRADSGCLPFLLTSAMPSRVRRWPRFASNSASIARVCRNSRPNGSFQSQTDPPRPNSTSRSDRSVRIWSASAMVRANLVQAATVAAGGPGEAPVDVDPIGRDAEREQLLGLDDHVLFIGGTAGAPIPDGIGSHSVHAPVFRLGPLVGTVRGTLLRNTRPGAPPQDQSRRSPPSAARPDGPYSLALPCLGRLLGSCLARRFVARFGRHRTLPASGTLRACRPAIQPGTGRRHRPPHRDRGRRCRHAGHPLPRREHAGEQVAGLT
ncbi:hypothetical protein ACRB68_69680 [Actinomadura sp. RB68]|uniref:Uncharacterized protein n=1 Tax=Actinomadura macrotermitis TaxID=2585200 RepID=A0A7K0C5X9_9ACTN|nr:hypothetical protein [Actinomadura macrotermitis]